MVPFSLLSLALSLKVCALFMMSRLAFSNLCSRRFFSTWAAWSRVPLAAQKRATVPFLRRDNPGTVPRCVLVRVHQELIKLVSVEGDRSGVHSQVLRIILDEPLVLVHHGLEVEHILFLSLIVHTKKLETRCNSWFEENNSLISANIYTVVKGEIYPFYKFTPKST